MRRGHSEEKRQASPQRQEQQHIMKRKGEDRHREQRGDKAEKKRNKEAEAQRGNKGDTW
ncbi:hypothetical protein KI387_018658, partial [Taxus chinensis]